MVIEDWLATTTSDRPTESFRMLFVLLLAKKISRTLTSLGAAQFPTLMTKRPRPLPLLPPKGFSGEALIVSIVCLTAYSNKNQRTDQFLHYGFALRLVASCPQAAFPSSPRVVRI